MASLIVNEFYDRALSEKFRVAAASLRRVDVSVTALSRIRPGLPVRQDFFNPCDTVESSVPLIAKIDDFLGRHTGKIMLPDEYRASREEMRGLLAEVQGWLEDNAAAGELALDLLPLTEPERAAAIDAVPLEQLRAFLAGWEADEGKPFMTEIDVRASEPDIFFVRNVLCAAGERPPAAGSIALPAAKMPYLPKI